MDPGAAHLLEASIKLRCSIEVTARSLIIYHHFKRCARVLEIVCDENMIAAGCLNLSASLYEQSLDIDAIICVFHSIINQTMEPLNADDQAYILIRQTVAWCGFIIMRIVEFDVNHRLAHQFLVPFLAMIFERSKNIADFHEELGSTCIRFMNDFYTQQECLEYQPQLIAAACIDLALYVHGLINDLTMVPAWYMGFVCDITPSKVKIIKTILMNLYEKPVIIPEPAFRAVVPDEAVLAKRRLLIHAIIETGEIPPELLLLQEDEVQEVKTVEAMDICPVVQQN